MYGFLTHGDGDIWVDEPKSLESQIPLTSELVEVVYSSLFKMSTASLLEDAAEAFLLQENMLLLWNLSLLSGHQDNEG